MAQATLGDLMTPEEMKIIEGRYSSNHPIFHLPIRVFQDIAPAIVSTIPQGATSLYVAALMVLDRRAQEKGLSII
jgi:hypothetical protein